MAEAIQGLHRALLEDWMNVRQAAARLDLSTNWVNRLVRTGDLTAMETPAGRLVSRQAVEALVAERAAKAQQAE